MDGDGNHHSADNDNGSSDEFSDAVDSPMVVKLTCPVAGCTGGTGGAARTCKVEPSCAAALLQVHGYTHQPTPAATAPAGDRRPRPPTLQPPKLEAQCSEARFEDWKVDQLEAVINR